MLSCLELLNTFSYFTLYDFVHVFSPVKKFIFLQLPYFSDKLMFNYQILPQIS